MLGLSLIMIHVWISNTFQTLQRKLGMEHSSDKQGRILQRFLWLQAKRHLKSIKIQRLRLER